MKKQLPLYTIEQTINTYKYSFEPNPEFGMDCYVDNFQAKDIVLLDDTKAGSQGIPLRFGYYAFFLRLQGETKRTINQFNYLIKPQSLHLVNPGTLYSFKDITQASRTYVLLFNKEFIEEGNLALDIQESLFEFHRKHQEDVHLDVTQYSLVLSIYEQLSEELKSKKGDYKIVVKMLINQLLYILKREKLKVNVSENLTRAQQISSEFLILIQENFCKIKSVKEYAKILGITPKHLSETVQSTRHHTALSYIHLRIIREVQYLLCFSDMSIKQIAYALNFETPSQFGRFFKRHEGLSPKEYRLKNRIAPFINQSRSSLESPDQQAEELPDALSE
ncbi:MAG: helix-turn-helix domain-containing protein [Campylobacterota bacterium]|nr:helix-turn-helix domain-containing protein [Campylobacterota bacterium]